MTMIQDLVVLLGVKRYFHFGEWFIFLLSFLLYIEDSKLPFKSLKYGRKWIY